MGKDEYAAAGGGALKLKGAKSAGVDKKRKKEKKEKSKTSEALQTALSKEDTPIRKDEELDLKNTEDLDPRIPAKTEAERRHEEMRKKRVRAADVLSFSTWH